MRSGERDVGERCLRGIASQVGPSRRVGRDGWRHRAIHSSPSGWVILSAYSEKAGERGLCGATVWGRLTGGMGAAGRHRAGIYSLPGRLVLLVRGAENLAMVKGVEVVGAPIQDICSPPIDYQPSSHRPLARTRRTVRHPPHSALRAAAPPVVSSLRRPHSDGVSSSRLRPLVVATGGTVFLSVHRFVCEQTKR